MPDPGVPRGIAAAPWAERAGAMRIKESLQAAKAVASDLSAENSLLEAQLHASTLEHRREGRKSIATINELAGELAVALDRTRPCRVGLSAKHGRLQGPRGRPATSNVADRGA